MEEARRKTFLPSGALQAAAIIQALQAIWILINKKL